MTAPEQMKEALKEELLLAQPLMDVDLVKKEFLDWLAELHLPVSPEQHDWDESLKVNPPTKDEQLAGEGHRVRLSLNLHTRENHYLILVIENLAPDSRDVYAISAHVKWRKDEWQMQRRADANYKGEFSDIPMSRHTLWAQNFRVGELCDALNACAVAILGHELVPHTDDTAAKRDTLPRNYAPTPLDLPKKNIDDNTTGKTEDE